MSAPAEITRILHDLRERKPAALDELLPLVYDELRRIADSYMRRQPGHHTLQPTALLHEAYLRLAGAPQHDYHDRTHFFAAAAAAMRHILVDHARARQADKRGGGRTLLPLNEELAGAGREADLVALDDALTALATHDARKARVLELRIFAGLSVEETAEALGISVATVGREYRFAEAWLRREMAGG
jgi:RNA polymerase sigma factor (TIGR02999 family)